MPPTIIHPAACRTDIERQLCQTWEQLLDTDVEAADSFFDLGGYSLLVVEAVRLARESGLDLRAADVFAEPTPAGLAGLLAARADGAPDSRPGESATLRAETVWRDFLSPWDAAAPRCLVPIEPNGTGLPLFVVHWGNGNVRFLSRVARAWSAGRPVYGFEASGYRDNVRPFVSIHEMAERYLDELRTAQPHGPYHLGGLCQGGLVAFEMARRLRAAGEQVALLALVNAPTQEPMVDRGWGLDELLAFRMAALRTQFGLTDIADLPRILERMYPIAWYDDDVTPTDFARLQVLWTAGMFAQDHYELRPYDGRVLLFQENLAKDGTTANWLPIVPGAEVSWYEADGTLPIIEHPEVARIISAALSAEQ